ncbi:methyltransferase domain-containing protein [Roseiflexus sp.]|uniref:class I SAM-dependent methyltransferase n=1 Tax=Roseiflexus sp. TaxID=2562120 RepID=UPI00398A87F0
MTQTVHVVCDLCGSDNADPICQSRDFSEDSPDSFTIVRCRGCGLCYQSPRPVDLMPFYRRLSFPLLSDIAAGACSGTELTGLAAVYTNVVKRIVPLRTGRLLDIGCADGAFLVAMARSGWDVYGVEPNEAVARQANLRLKQFRSSRVFCGVLEEAGYVSGYFDLITLWHVIEHLPHPLATLREVRRLLRPGGQVIILTPRWGSLESLLFGRYWSGLDLPRHLWFFDDCSLQLLIERAGMTVTQRLRHPGYDQLSLSVLFLLRARFGVSVSMGVFRLMHTSLVKRVGLRLISLIDNTGLGTQMLYVAACEAPDNRVQQGTTPKEVPGLL